MVGFRRSGHICYNVIQGVKSIFDKVTVWPQLISKLLACMLLLIGLVIFLHPRYFCLALLLHAGVTVFLAKY